jgi:hypothetical protein
MEVEWSGMACVCGVGKKGPMVDQEHSIDCKRALHCIV